MEGGNNESIRIVFLAYYYMYDTNRQLFTLNGVVIHINSTSLCFISNDIGHRCVICGD